jgi:hypothetical protein
MEIKGELFSTDMVKAFLENRKIRTSRPIKPQPKYIESSGRWSWAIPKAKVHKGCCTEVFSASREWWNYLTPDQMPYQSGDIMYGRETWGIGGFDEDKSTMFVQYKADDATASIVLPSDKFQKYYEGMTGAEPDWRPSIHMPREAARLFYRITDAKAQNIADMTEQDAVEDGFKIRPQFSALVQFKHFWRQQYGTDANWMWVYYLKKISKEEALKDETNL